MKRMRPGQLQPNELEWAILERMARGEPWLQSAFSSLKILSREYTGVGSYTNFLCDASKAEDDSVIGLKALIRVSGVAGGMGAVLYCPGTLPNFLEVFTFGDERWDGTYESFVLEDDA